jgi:hypothetical protein
VSLYQIPPLPRRDTQSTKSKKIKQIVAVESVSRILSVCQPEIPASGRAIIPLGRTLLPGSSDLPGSCNAPSRHVLARAARLPPYLVLLRVGFSLPWTLLPRRCALTAPFHPYLALLAERGRRYVFCGTLRHPKLENLGPRRMAETGTPWPQVPGRYPAHCSAEFGLSSS